MLRGVYPGNIKCLQFAIIAAYELYAHTFHVTMDTLFGRELCTLGSRGCPLFNGVAEIANARSALDTANKSRSLGLRAGA